jgi:hypothetical protein
VLQVCRKQGKFLTHFSCEMAEAEKKTTGA